MDKSRYSPISNLRAFRKKSEINIGIGISNLKSLTVPLKEDSGSYCTNGCVN